jgi:hypothetical protein
MGAAVKPLNKRTSRGMSIRAARIHRLNERLAVEQDERVRRMIQAQLIALERRRV